MRGRVEPAQGVRYNPEGVVLESNAEKFGIFEVNAEKLAEYSEECRELLASPRGPFICKFYLGDVGETLDYFVYWMKRPDAHGDLKSLGKVINCDGYDEFIETWLLGDTLRARGFQDDVLRAMLDYSDDVELDSDDLENWLSRAPRGSAIRELLIDIFCRQLEVNGRQGEIRALNPVTLLEGSEKGTETKQEDADYRPFAPLTEDSLRRKLLPQELQDEDDDGEEFEINIRSLTKSTPVAQTSRPPPTAAPFLSHAGRGRQGQTPPANIRSPSVPVNLEAGEASEKGMKFIAFKLVKRYPFLYVGESNQGEVAAFFKENFNKRTWDFFYILDPNESKTASRDPLLLVPSVQFEQFLNFASATTGRSLSIPGGQARENFFLTFGDWNTPLPRFLGRANSEEDFEDLSFKIYTFPKDDYDNLTAAALRSFKEVMARAYNSFRVPTRKKNPETVKMKRIERQKNLGRVTKRVQRYLGLRPQAAYASRIGPAASGWNTDKPAPFIKDSSVRFVCVDVEAYEKNAELVTEIGLAVLDTDDIMDVAPGENGENWFSKIATVHFRIMEYSSIINSQFVQGCPDSFAFGNSDFVSLKDIAQEVGDIIGDNVSGDKRPVILVGHDIAQDLAYLQKVGYNPWRMPHIVDEIDTMSMFQRLKRSQDGRGLETVCSDLGYPGYDFHNAGNDAHFTLRSMIVMAFRQMSESLSSKALGPWGQDAREWSDGELDDGGPPQRSQDRVRKAAQPATQRREPRW
ncbi:hypothetical protein DL766_000201 [Monosporascus sp. MC13-8B]|uniref:Gfd2/YDR514C-like C-terminal domain-containing protein n=1 Tax=Monosporascus cannonballus TaxID=155416 RepID=A0ABY0H6C0_9PEZI|nr:hypothetical protein DL762_006539 [Monosporascus cannonballus]RYO83753.1 hypothetical protein DL763_007716 [Monosporascus cannonballus]RYP39759.1 hypothetical protein DL766_000201 [Monosporascus sp. MC13-8B]